MLAAKAPQPTCCAKPRKRDSLAKRTKSSRSWTTWRPNTSRSHSLSAAKSAGVSNWLVYAEGVREHIEVTRLFCYRSYPVTDTRARYRTMAEDHGGETLHETAGRVPRACPASSRQEPGGGLVTAGVNEASLVPPAGFEPALPPPEAGTRHAL